MIELGKIVEFFLVGFSTVFNRNFSFSQIGCQAMIESSLTCYLSNIFNKRSRFVLFPKALVKKMKDVHSNFVRHCLDPEFILCI